MYLVQNPTFVNPDSFNSVDDLRRELHRANATLTKYWTAIEQRDIAGREFIALVHSLLMQHVRGDHRGVAAILDAHLEASPRLREMIEETNESKEILQVRQWEKASSTEQKAAEPLPRYNCKGADPWSKRTDAELRAALDVANRAGVETMRELKALSGRVESMAREMSAIVDAHLKGDRDAVSKAVSTFCEKHVVVKNVPNEKVH